MADAAKPSPHVQMGDAPYAVLGRTLGHSWSPEIHAQFGSAPYRIVELEENEFEQFVRTHAWRGLNVTIPYKLLAAKIADEASPRVVATGAANTLVRRSDGTILAENTDVLGFNWMLARFAKRELGRSAAEAFGGEKVLVLGSGGASAAVVFALREYVGCKDVRVISRSGEDTYETLLERHADAALIVNTTPVGMYPNCPATPVSREVLAQMHRLAGVVDVVYNPERTGLCLAAESLGIPCESGLAMLVAQALYASELFQGKDLDDALIEKVERELRRKTRNIVLIGMPGTGKTTTGRALMRLTGRAFIDLDTAFEIETGVSAGDYIAKHGEEAFRAVETQVCAREAAKSGVVIACGGGIVTRPENYELLHQNGDIVLLERPLDQLATHGRPLSRTKGVEQLAAERMPLYHAWADYVVQCTGSPESDARAILG